MIGIYFLIKSNYEKSLNSLIIDVYKGMNIGEQWTL